MKHIVVLGSTGSIGRQALEVAATHPDLFKIVGLAARSNLDLLAEQVEQFEPEIVAVGEADQTEALRQRLIGFKGVISGGLDGLVQAATWPGASIVLTAVVGAAGLYPTIEAIRAGKDIALANKETLVAAGEIVMGEVKRQGVKLLPVDSEHSAIWQSLHGQYRPGLKRIILTASGGPFRDYSPAELEEVTVDDALRHPTWRMGPKITIDSATLMNKGLEVIEAHWLFGAAYDQIAVVIHPESIIHSLVEFVDGSHIAQMGTPDMRVPIQYALTYPERRVTAAPPLDLTAVGRLNFRAPDTGRFPCLQYAYEAGKIGGTMPAVLNAANEAAVSLFLQGRIRFTEIPRLIRQAMDGHTPTSRPSLKEILAADEWARKLVFSKV